jgi:shikimate dehydrogenase
VSLSGTTRLAAIIGDPVGHSLSPVLHNTAYAAMGLDWAYVAFAVPAGRAPAAVDAARTLGMVGLSVTMPHKTAVAEACDALDSDAALLRSVNTVTIDGTAALGSSTDGEGFIRSLRAAGHEPASMRVLVLGAGGAARAVVVALARTGAKVSVSARRERAAGDAAGLVADTPDTAVVSWDDRAAAAAAADLLVNATPIGMAGGPAPTDLPVPETVLRPGLLVTDLVYHPLETPLLASAAASGAGTVDGLGMLVHQAALQIERWSSRPAPAGRMRAAALSALSTVS